MQVIQWITARSFDGYVWQILERKARFIHDVMSPSLDVREIGDVGDTVLSFSEAKALATDNPLLIAHDTSSRDETRAAFARYRDHRRWHHSPVNRPWHEAHDADLEAGQ